MDKYVYPPQNLIVTAVQLQGPCKTLENRFFGYSRAVGIHVSNLV